MVSLYTSEWIEIFMKQVYFESDLSHSIRVSGLKWYRLVCRRSDFNVSLYTSEWIEITIRPH